MLFRIPRINFDPSLDNCFRIIFNATKMDDLVEAFRKLSLEESKVEEKSQALHETTIGGKRKFGAVMARFSKWSGYQKPRKISRSILVEVLDPSCFVDTNRTAESNVRQNSLESSSSPGSSSSTSDGSPRRKKRGAQGIGDVYESEEGIIQFQSHVVALRRLKMQIAKIEEKKKMRPPTPPPLPPSLPKVFTKPMEFNDAELRFLEDKGSDTPDRRKVIRQTPAEYKRNMESFRKTQQEILDRRRQRKCRPQAGYV